MAALPLGVVAELIHPVGHDIPDLLATSSAISHPLTALAWLLIIWGLAALYGRHAAEGGLPLLLGYVITMTHGVLMVGVMLFKGLIVPTLADAPATQALVAPDGVLAEPGNVFVIVSWIVGILLLSAGLLRARVVFPWAGLLPILGIVTAMLFFLVFAVEGFLGNLAYAAAVGLVYAGFALGGYTLLGTRKPT